MTTTHICRIIPALLCLAIPGLAQERWELGFSAGYGFHKNLTATNSAGEASVGFKPGVAFSVFGSDQINGWLAGEARYTYRQNDAWVAARGTESRFDAESHVFHYDLIFPVAKRSAVVRPFLAAGGGVKVYRGTGREAAFQPLSNFAVLTRATQIVPVISVGGGVKVELSRLITLRVEARDYISTFPSEVIAPVPSARVHGWLHDFVPMIGLSFRLGR
jgi:hypothetical protein